MYHLGTTSGLHLNLYVIPKKLVESIYLQIVKYLESNNNI